MTPEEIIAWAQELISEARRAGDATRIRIIMERADVLLALAREQGGGGKMMPGMRDSHRRALSEVAAPDHPALEAARAAGLLTMADVARHLGVTRSFLSQVVSGRKRMPADKAAAFERKTGYPANRWS